MTRDIFLSLVLLVAISTFLSACSPIYVIRAAYEQSKIIINREKIPDVISAKDTSEDIRKKLSLVIEAREFAKNLGFNTEDAYTYYTKYEKDVLSWIVVGSKPDSFTLVGWWFPIVGTVPYKGYFEKEDAEALAKDLEKDGYETSVRGATAFSTLGWFNDPILTPALKGNNFELVSTVIHELVHRTKWVKGDVPFNESLAQFIGLEGMVQFYKGKPEEIDALRYRDNWHLFAYNIEDLYGKLEKIYNSDIPKDEKLTEKNRLFAECKNNLRAIFPKSETFEKPNNADLMQIKMYTGRYSEFEEKLMRSNQKLGEFVTDFEKYYNQNSSDQ